MTVHELAELLRDLPEDAELVAEYDRGNAGGEIMGIRFDGDQVVIVIG